uniref:Sugar transporter n=1 Tax=Nilaparvata lugens TaxID=108931 RepID=A0A0A8J8K5_NILLU|nr:sugar transporter [Nilaparvata lugens]
MDTKAAKSAARRQYLATIIGNLSSLCIGMMLGWTSPVQPLLMSETPPVGNYSLTRTEVSWIGSMNFIGGAAGTLFWGKVSDALGRKMAGCLIAFPFTLGWILMLVGTDFVWIVVARFVTGVGCSGAVINTPLYVAEVSEDKRRGALGSCFMMFLNLGVVVSYTIGSFTSYHTFTSICLSVPIIYLSLFFWLPESPVSAFVRGKKSVAETSLLWYRGNDSVAVAKEISRLQARADSIKNNRASFLSLFSSRGTIKALIIGIGFSFGQQFCGILAILTYSVMLFKEAGTELSPFTGAIIVGLLQLCSSFVSSQLVDKAGRKVLLVTSYTVMSLTLLALGLYFDVKAYDRFDLSEWSTIPIWAMSIHVIFYSIGAGPVPFVVISETFRPEIRGIAVAIVMFFSTTLSFASVRLFPIVVELVGLHGCFWSYAASCILLTFFTVVLVPETKGRSLQAILKELEGEKQESDAEGADAELCTVKNIRIVKSNKTNSNVR